VIRACSRYLCAIIFGGLASTTLACGYCIEDKIAAVYDYDVITRALSRQHRVAFFTVEGAMAASEDSRRALKAAVESVAGVDKGSARVSVDPAALSAAFDPARASSASMERALSRKLAVHGLSVTTVRVMDNRSALKSPSNP
jgi:hypothetical protein